MDNEMISDASFEALQTLFLLFGWAGFGICPKDILVPLTQEDILFPVDELGIT
jgi:hypothetical protein